MEVTYVLGKMVTLAFMMCIGYVARKARVLDETGSKTISGLILNVTLPCMMLDSLSSSKATTSEILLMVLISFLFYFVFILLAVWVPRLFCTEQSEVPLFRFFTVFTNNGYMGFPIIKALYGSSALIYASAINIPVNILMFTYGVYQFDRLSRGTDKPAVQWKSMINVPIVSGLLTMIFAVLHVRFRGIPQEIFSSVGDMTVPLSMMVVGSSLASQPLRKVFGGFRVYLFSVVRLLVFPIMTWAVLYYVPVNPLIKSVLIVISGMPCAANSVIFAEQYDGNAALASQYVFVTTLLSVLTIPLLGATLLSL